ncbi:two-component system cell cycle response regulator CtrA [Ancylobacter sp. 3268]|uniref:helix-turn-helix domain-containing protein n=1 Tax=Ancylobacter sp. 3268 TaxID=2817752 RepID=UPI00285ED552|nr:helix-turn-helix domain-containing protein [Ancylobacter sp. 3268]MDR6953812.1 two-component system cell cycle response regulator CtrA [Ancylobacter sp. 3268]
MDANARADALEAENDRLRQRIDQLEAVLGVTFPAPVEWRLTRSEACVCGVLLKRELATKAAVMAALYRADGRDEPDTKIADVFICKIRKKLTPFGIVITTRHGLGWELRGRAELARSLGLTP